MNCKLKLRKPLFKCYSTNISHSEPIVLTLNDGTSIPYPRGARKLIDPSQVFLHGEKAIGTYFLLEETNLDKLVSLIRKMNFWFEHNTLLMDRHTRISL
jgi:hypothetical protein